MNHFKFIFSHLAAFLSGTIAVAIYHHWWINPGQVKWIMDIAKPHTDIGYPGDWVLDILFPAIPLFGLCLGITVVLWLVEFLMKFKK